MSLRLGGLSLSEVFDGPEHVLCNGFLILNNFLNDDGLWESFFDSLGHDGLCSSVKQLLFTVAERMSLDVTCSISNTGVCLPIVVTSSLLTWAEITVSFLVHFGGFTFFFHRSTIGVKYILGRHADSRGNTVRVLLSCLSNLLGPVVTSLIAHTKRFTDSRCILTLLSIIEFISEAIQIL